jgi:hypothetical protein
MDRVEYTTMVGQVQKLRELARQQQELDTARIYAAYAQLATNASFDIVLSSWIQRVLLAPITTEAEMGRHDFVLSILTDLRNAVEGARMPRGLAE